MWPSIQRRRSRDVLWRQELPDWFRGRGGSRAKGSVRVVVDSVCGGGEVRSCANVDVDDYGRCSCQYGDEGLEMCCGGESYRNASEAKAAAEQRGSVQFVVNSLCGGEKVRLSANLDVNNNGRCGLRYGDESLGMCCGGESYWTGSEAAVVEEQRGRVRVVIDSVCGSGEVNRVRTSTLTTTDDAAIDTETKV